MKKNFVFSGNNVTINYKNTIDDKILIESLECFHRFQISSIFHPDIRRVYNKGLNIEKSKHLERTCIKINTFSTATKERLVEGYVYERHIFDHKINMIDKSLKRLKEIVKYSKKSKLEFVSFALDF